MAEAISEQLKNTSLNVNENHLSENADSGSFDPSAGATAAGTTPDDSDPLEVTVRALVSSKAAGIIIGRGGQAVAEVRSQTGVKAGVSKTVPGVVDRILSITGSPEAIGSALRMISNTLAQSFVGEMQTQPGAPPASVNFLIPHAAMGALIGKSGARIKEIQDASGSRMVAHKDMLPQSTERIVEISGSPDSIGVASKAVAETLQAEGDKLHGSVLFHPQAIGPEGPAAGVQLAQGGVPFGNMSVMTGAGVAAAGYQTAGSRGGRGGRRVGTYGSSAAPRTLSAGSSFQSAPFGQSAAFPVQTSGMPAPIFNPEDPTLRTQHISFPADMIGCIIGKGGSRISEIRRASGSRISIAREPNASGERLFSIVGTTDSNEKALYLLYSSLEAEKERRSQYEQDNQQGEEGLAGAGGQSASS